MPKSILKLSITLASFLFGLVGTSYYYGYRFKHKQYDKIEPFYHLRYPSLVLNDLLKKENNDGGFEIHPFKVLKIYGGAQVEIDSLPPNSGDAWKITADSLCYPKKCIYYLADTAFIQGPVGMDTDLGVCYQNPVRFLIPKSISQFTVKVENWSSFTMRGLEVINMEINISDSTGGSVILRNNKFTQLNYTVRGGTKRHMPHLALINNELGTVSLSAPGPQNFTFWGNTYSGISAQISDSSTFTVSLNDFQELYQKRKGKAAITLIK